MTKRRIVKTLASLAVLVATTSVALLAMEEPEEPATRPSEEGPEEPGPDSQAAASLEVPTPQHEVLVQFLGNWETTTRFFSSAGEELDATTGKSAFRFVLGRHYVMETFRGDLGGQVYEELGFLGFDPLREQFVATWMNNAELRPTRAAGVYDPDARTLVLHGTRDDHSSRSIRMEKYVFRILGPDEIVFQVFDPTGDSDRLRTEIRYRRIAAEPATPEEE